MRDALELLLDVVGETRAREIVAGMGTRTAQLELDRLTAVRMAVRMLAERSSRPTIRDRLVARGVRVRSAYRLISDALAYGPFSCDTNGPSLSLAPETLGPSNEQEPSAIMEQQTTTAAKPDHLHAAANAIRARLAAIDLPAAREAVKQALAARDALPDTGTGARQSPPNADLATPTLLESIATRDAIVQEAKAAPSRLRKLEAEEQQLRRDLAEIEALIDGEATLERARQAEVAATQAYSSSMRTRLECEQALQRLTSLVESEQLLLEEGRRAAGADVLAAIKGGATDVTVAPSNSDRLAALLGAKDAAHDELQAAHAAEKSARGRVANARQQVLVAQGTTLEAAFKPIEEAYHEKLVALIVAKSNARMTYMPADPRERARREAGHILGVFN